MLPKTLTSCGSDSHFIPGKVVIKLAKKDRIARSREIILSTWGWSILIATEALGTDGIGSWRAMAAAVCFGMRRGSR